MAAGLSLSDLENSLKMEWYEPRTDAELQQTAQNRYASVYNQKRLTANQNYEKTDLAYQNQLNTLADTLAYSQEQLVKQTNDSIASANRNMITRGMQRSSYSAANEARLAAAGNANLAQLLREYSTNVNNIGSQRTQLAQQLADTLAAYDTDMQTDILAYIDEQKQLDYERRNASVQYWNSLLFDLYSATKSGGSGGGGGGSRSSSGTQPKTGYEVDDASVNNLRNELDNKGYVERNIGSNVVWVPKSGASGKKSTN